MTDALKVISENTAKSAAISESGTVITRRWSDVVFGADTDSENESEDPRSCREIAQDIFSRIRGENNNERI